MSVRNALRTLAGLVVLALVAGVFYVDVLPVRAGTAVLETKLVPDVPDSGFGRSVAIDGDTAVVGASADDGSAANAGAAFVYFFNGTTWEQQARLVASDAAADDFFGLAVAISGDTIVVGADGEDGGPDDEAGAAYVFTRTGTTWAEQQKLTPPGRSPGATFGFSVDIDGETALIGADDGVSGLNGSAYVFVRNASVWSLQQQLSAADGTAGDLFGGAVAVSDNTAVVGAQGDDSPWINSGSVYVFVRSGTTWSTPNKLTASDAAVGDAFGSAVDVDGDVLASGAWGVDKDPWNESSGAAYVFTRGSDSWSQAQRLGGTSNGYDRFGRAVAVQGTRVTISAPGRYECAGAIYEFEQVGSTWQEIAETRQTVSEYMANGCLFGRSIAVSGAHIAAGSMSDDEVGTNAGAAFLLLGAMAADVVSSGAEDTTSAWEPVVRDPGGGSPICTIGDQPEHGTATVQSDCSGGGYVPTADYHGPDLFTYVATIGSRVDTADVSMTVDSVDDTPIASDVAISGEEDTDGIVWAPSWWDPDDLIGSCSYAILSPPSHGTASAGMSCFDSGQYQPAANFSGIDSFTYSVSNGGGTTSATVTVTVDPWNDTPTAGDVSITGVEGETIVWHPDVRDIDGDVLECIVRSPSEGTATVASDCSSGTYRGPFGSNQFEYEVSDGDDVEGQASAIVTVAIGRGVPHITILGGTSVVSAGVATQLGLLGAPVSRIAGANRYATAAATATTRFASPVPIAFIATGENFPDALAGGPVAALAGGPILLVGRDSIPPETDHALSTLHPDTIVILGGSSVVSGTVEAQLQNRYGNVIRIAGANRYATAATIARFGFPDGAPTAYIATGENFPDALAGVPAAAINDGPILLTQPTSLPLETIAELKRLRPDQMYILGGNNAVSAAVEDQLSGLGFPTSMMRLSGSSRFATATTISKWSTWSLPRQIFIATGTNFPDALAGGPIAGMERGPILLVTADSIPPETLTEMKRLLGTG